MAATICQNRYGACEAQSTQLLTDLCLQIPSHRVGQQGQGIVDRSEEPFAWKALVCC